MPKLIITTVLYLAMLTASIMVRPTVMCEPPLTLPAIEWLRSWMP